MLKVFAQLTRLSPMATTSEDCCFHGWTVASEAPPSLGVEPAEREVAAEALELGERISRGHSDVADPDAAAAGAEIAPLMGGLEKFFQIAAPLASAPLSHSVGACSDRRPRRPRNWAHSPWP